MGQNFWSLKQHVQAWLDEKGITNCSVSGLGKGHHGVEMWIHGETSDQFIEKHGRSFETPHYKGCSPDKLKSSHHTYSKGSTTGHPQNASYHLSQ